jgi:cyclopropane fatty-acyl-phospholipid synthase-like methyltransferase/ribosome modulation factor
MVRESGHHSAQMNRPLPYRAAPGLHPVMQGEPIAWQADVADAPVVNKGTDHFDPKVVAHFHASAELYKRWSPEGHLHFGYWKPGINPFVRRAMLEEMVYEVVSALGTKPGMKIVDLGCGYGTAARLVARKYGCHVRALSAVEEQVAEGKSAAKGEGVADRVTMMRRDFRRTGLEDQSVDGVYALESMCYGAGNAKQDVIGEVARILKPGRRLAMADGFLMKPANGFRVGIVRTVEKGWALPCFPQRDAFLHALQAAGFTDIRVRDMSWNVAPCAFHGPLLMLRLEIARLLRGGKLDRLERAHLRSCMLGIALGTQRDLFRYLIVSARKA